MNTSRHTSYACTYLLAMLKYNSKLIVPQDSNYFPKLSEVNSCRRGLLLVLIIYYYYYLFISDSIFLLYSFRSLNLGKLFRYV